MPVNSPYPETIANASTLPDVQPHVDMVKASDMNNVRAFIRDITAAVGADPQGSCSDLVSRLSGILSADGKLLTMPNTLTVGPSVCQFTSIQDAIDSISDATESNQYTIVIYPGTYDENLTLKPYVHLQGFTPIIHSIYQYPLNHPVISPATGHCLTNSSSSHININALKFVCNDASFLNSSCSIHVSLSYCIISGNASSFSLLSPNLYPYFWASHCYIDATTYDSILQTSDTAYGYTICNFSNCHLIGDFDLNTSGEYSLKLEIIKTYWRGRYRSQLYSSEIFMFDSIHDMTNSYGYKLNSPEGDSFNILYSTIVNHYENIFICESGDCYCSLTALHSHFSREIESWVSFNSASAGNTFGDFNIGQHHFI